MSESKAYIGTYLGEEAVHLTFGSYEATILPAIGANLISFRHKDKQYTILREPESIEALRATPGIYGIPVLFPPNRYEDGKFPWNGKTYQFPVNEASTNNHLHGFLLDIPWKLEHFSADELESRAVLSVTIDEHHEVYSYLPHHFTIRLRYALDQNGLQQQVFVHNHGSEPMPCLLAFHTTINAPFVASSTAKDYTFKLTIGKRWQLNERMLPTGQYQALTPEEEKMKQGGLSPFFAAMDNHYTSEPQNGRNRMELYDAKEQVTLVYDVGTAYKQWMIWNNNKTEGFFCPEPQINLVNAPNVNLPAEEIGLVALKPGEIFEETSRLYIVNGKL